MSATETKGAARDWAQALVPYRRASAARGVLELTATFPPFVAVWTAMLLASRHGQFWLSFALAPLAAGLLIRLFVIQHDCGHGSFFPSKLANDWVGRAISVLTLTPYDHWRRCHAIHHATSGNLDRRGVGDVKTLTAREYFARNWRDRMRYRLYPHPLVMWGWAQPICSCWRTACPSASCARAPCRGSAQWPPTPGSCSRPVF